MRYRSWKITHTHSHEGKNMKSSHTVLGEKVLGGKNVRKQFSQLQPSE